MSLMSTRCRLRNAIMTAVWLMLFTLSFQTFAGSDEEMQWKSTLKLCKRAREMEKRILDASDEQRREIAAEAAAELDEKYETTMERLEGPIRAFFIYYRDVRLERFSGRDMKFSERILEAAREPAVTPLIFVEVPRDIFSFWRRQYHLRRLLPVSRYSNAVVNPETGDMRPTAERGWESIPSVIPGRWSTGKTCAELAEKLLPHLPARYVRDAWLELIYVKYEPPLVDRIDETEHTWLSPETAPIWLRLAELEYELNEPEMAAVFLIKAMAFGTDEHFEKGREMMEQWGRVDIDPEPFVPEDAEPPSVEDVWRLFTLYRRLLMHPRGIAIMDHFEHLLRDEKLRFMFRPGAPPSGLKELSFEELRQAYIEDWEKMASAYVAGREGRLTIFDQPAETEEQRLAIEVPSPLQREVAEELADILKEAVREKLK